MGQPLRGERIAKQLGLGGQYDFIVTPLKQQHGSVRLVTWVSGDLSR